MSRVLPRHLRSLDLIGVLSLFLVTTLAACSAGTAAPATTRVPELAASTAAPAPSAPVRSTLRGSPHAVDQTPARSAGPPTVTGTPSGAPSPQTVTAPRLAPAPQSTPTPAPQTTPAPRLAPAPAPAPQSTPTPAPRTTPTGPGTAVSTPGPRKTSADLDVAGPDQGPRCAVARRYSDEPPTGLRADVRAAWLSVKKQAAAKGVVLCLNDGKRSRAQQVALFDTYVRVYGRAAADDLVLPWTSSAHVKGYAVDVQPAAAYQWLQQTKGRLGFCRIYDNEAWHFEYSRAYRTSGCPARQPKPVR